MLAACALPREEVLCKRCVEEERHRHPITGKRAHLVSADHIGTSKRLDRTQAAQQCPTAGQGTYRHCQRQGDGW
ncbi:hypothetical protein KSD_79580 [Ktedonobacter sp. SOSP1-85]|nr:hypothetical protein KSD_79580 [Ktedonobacter sp. SOSP1-85]